MADFTIGSFNCKWGCFNDNEKKEFRNESKNMTIRRFVEEENLDILALQEYRISDNPLFGNKAMSKNFDILVPGWDISGFSFAKKRGVDFSFEQTEEYNIESRYSCVDNGYAIMWNRERFEMITSEKWEQDIEKIRQKYNIARPPQILRLKYKMGNSKGCEIRIINTHLTYSGKEAKKIYVKKRDYSWHMFRLIDIEKKKPPEIKRPEIKRKEELDKCLNMYEKIAVEITRDTLPSLHTILLGDFNLTPSECNNVLGKTRVTLPNYPNYKNLELKQEKLTTLKRKMVLNKGVYFNKSYDHFIIDPSLRTNSTVIDTVFKYFGNRNDIHYLQFSDHIPIKLEVALP
jgi:endonuclease/exonuclease/phosphatase family metal-dependent hydrolase